MTLKFTLLCLMIYSIVMWAFMMSNVLTGFSIPWEKKQKADDEIKVGDVVERYISGKFDSTGIYLGEDGDYWNCLFWTGAVFTTFAYPKNQFKKTGIHLGIDKIMEEMRDEK